MDDHCMQWPECGCYDECAIDKSEAQEIEASHAVVESHPSPFGRVVASPEGAKRRTQ